MENKIEEALKILDEVVEGNKQLLSTGLLPRIMEDQLLPTNNALILVIEYVRDHEELKKL